MSGFASLQSLTIFDNDHFPARKEVGQVRGRKSGPRGKKAPSRNFTFKTQTRPAREMGVTFLEGGWHSLVAGVSAALHRWNRHPWT